MTFILAPMISCTREAGIGGCRCGTTRGSLDAPAFLTGQPGARRHPTRSSQVRGGKKRAPVFRLDDQMQVISLHRVMGEAEAESLAPREECAFNGLYADLAA